MKTAVTGTPGTGKTSVASRLAADGYTVLHVSELASPYVCGRDEERDCDIVDVDAMDELFRGRTDDLLVDGHLSHLLSVDQAVVLRCHPDVLARRLRNRGWSQRKIRENVMAEALDVILLDAVERHGGKRVAQIDTSDRTVDAVAGMVAGLHDDGLSPDAGDIVNWSAWLVDHAG